MKIQLISVGRQNESYIKAGVEDFTNRINKYFAVQWQLIGPVKNGDALSSNELKKHEAALTLKALQKDDYLILLDENGIEIASEKLANMLEQPVVNSAKRLVFLIGGVYGADETLKQRADFTWCLSKLTLPHMLVRLILAEQLYRACTILKNEKYHHK